MEIAVIFHKQCPDGFGGATVANQYFENTGHSVTFHPTTYGDEVPNVEGKSVYLIDFCFPREDLAKLCASAKKVVVLDHHLTTEQELDGWEPPSNCTVVVDKSHSGCVLAWKHFYPELPVPWMLRYIEDRDLWTYKHADTRNYLAWLDTLKFNFEVWKIALNQSDSIRTEVTEVGKIMNDRFMACCIKIAHDATPVEIDGVVGLMACASGEFHSEVGNLLATASGTFGLVWHVRKDGQVKCGIRSNGDFNVQEIAKKFGGGGHLNSSGFTGGETLLLQLFNNKLSSSN